MLPDTGERYLSTFLFEGVNEGSDDTWLAQQAWDRTPSAPLVSNAPAFARHSGESRNPV